VKNAWGLFKTTLILFCFLFFNLAIAGQDLAQVSIPKNKNLSHGYFTYKKFLLIDGSVDGNVFCMGGRTSVHGEVKGNITVIFGVLEVAKDAKVSGKLITIGSPFVGIQEQVDKRIDIPIRDVFYPNNLSWLELMKRSILRIIIAFSICSLLIMFKPKHIRETGREIRTDWVPTFFAGSFLTVFLGMALFGSIMIFAHPLGPILFISISAMVSIIAIFGLVSVFEAIAHYLNRIMPPKTGFAHSLFLAIVICEIGCTLPYIGPAVQLILFILGLGATLLTRFGSNKGWLTKSKKVWSA